MHIRHLLLLCFALGASGCPLAVTSSTAFPCEDDSDCTGGYLCSFDDVCAPEDEVRQLRQDAGAPDVVEPEPDPPQDGGEPDVVVTDAGGGEPDVVTDAGGGEPDVVVTDAGGGEPDVVVTDAGGGEPDAGVDAGANVDAGVGIDAGVDAGAGIDAGVDAGVENDAGVDAGVEVDAGIDAGVVNQPPAFEPLDTVFCRENQPCLITVAYTDPDDAPDRLTLLMTSPPTSGAVSKSDETSLQYTPNPDHVGYDSFVVEVADEEGATDALTVELYVVRHHTCQTIRTTSNELLASDVYPIDPDGQGDFDAYCHMEGSDGWTLVLKADGHNTTFAYEAALWEDGNVLADDSLDLSSTESKTEAFLRHPVDDVRVVFGPSGANSFSNLFDLTTTEIDLSVTAHSMRELMNRGTTRTYVDYATWGALMPTPQQFYCNHDGFNVDLRTGNSDHYRYRIGILFDEEAACRQPDSGIGVGGTGQACGGQQVVVGGAANCTGFPAEHVRVFAAVFVKAVSRVEVRATCADHLDAGRDADGLYYVDNGNSDDVQQVYCNQTFNGGGWMLVGRSGNDGRGNFGWSSRSGSAATVEHWHYSLDAVRMGFTPTQILVGRGNGTSNGIYDFGYTWPEAGRTLPTDLLQNHGNSRHRAHDVTHGILGGCNPTSGRAFEYIGHTDDTNKFYFDDDDHNNEDQGLHGDGFDLHGSNNDCNNNGRLDGYHGVMFIR